MKALKGIVFWTGVGLMLAAIVASGYMVFAIEAFFGGEPGGPVSQYFFDNRWYFLLASIFVIIVMSAFYIILDGDRFRWLPSFYIKNFIEKLMKIDGLRQIYFSELKAIERTLFMREHERVGPRAKFSAHLGLMSSTPIAPLMGVFRVELWPSLFWIAITGLLVFMIAYRYSEKPLTYTEKLDQLLYEYEPVDRDNYQLLQHRTKQSGFLYNDFVFDWLKQETYAVRLVGGLEAPQVFRFLDKKMGKNERQYG